MYDANAQRQLEANLLQIETGRQLSALAHGGFSVCGPRTEVRSSCSVVRMRTGRALALGGAAQSRSAHRNTAIMIHRRDGLSARRRIRIVASHGAPRERRFEQRRAVVF